MAMTQPKIVPFDHQYIPGSVTLSRAEQWPHSASDWRMVANISDGVVALADGQVAGTAFCTPFGDKMAAFNMIIVASSLRGRGVGKTLMQRLMDLAGSRTVRLVATEAGYPLYVKMGFSQIGSIRQYQGTLSDAPMPPTQAITPASTDDHAMIYELDTLKSHLDRKALWQELFACSEVKVIRDNGKVIAVSACRDFGRGKVVGPVIANDIHQAKGLIARHLAEHPEAFIRIDTSTDSGLGEWLEHLGLEHAGGGKVMLRGEAPCKDDQALYALASQAVG